MERSEPTDIDPDEVARLRALVAAIPDPIYRIKADGTFLSVEVPDDHPDAVPQESIPGLSIETVMPPRQAAVVMDALREALASGALVTVDYDLVMAGVQRWWEARLVPAGGEVVAIVREITDRRRTEAEQLRKARTDAITGLANRAAFEDELDHAMARALRTGRPLALLYGDLDGFKAVNDRRGHVVGDAVLREVANRITSTLRDIDLAARIGGDEFAIVVEDLGSSDEVEQVGERLVAAVCAPYTVDGDEDRIGLSIGVAIFPDDASDRSALVQAADAAMYRAKSDGGCRVELAPSSG